MICHPDELWSVARQVWTCRTTVVGDSRRRVSASTCDFFCILLAIERIFFLTTKVMSYIESMLLIWLIQACTDCRKGAGQLCEILKRRHRSHLPDIHRALLHTGQQDVAELLGFQGLSGVWTIRCHTSSSFLACLRTYSAIHLLPQLIRPKTFLFMPVNVCCMSHRANKFGMLFTILVITLFIFNTLPFLFKF